MCYTKCSDECNKSCLDNNLPINLKK
jgi:hypothetical protein